MSNEATIQAILTACRDRGILLNSSGENLGVDAPEGAITPDLMDGFRQHKSSLLGILRRDEDEPDVTQHDVESRHEALPTIPADADVTAWEEYIEPPDPCPKCGGLMFWWDALGGLHCMVCDKPKYATEKAAELRKLAKRLRQFPNTARYVRRCR